MQQYENVWLELHRSKSTLFPQYMIYEFLSPYSATCQLIVDYGVKFQGIPMFLIVFAYFD